MKLNQLNLEEKLNIVIFVKKTINKGEPSITVVICYDVEFHNSVLCLDCENIKEQLLNE